MSEGIVFVPAEEPGALDGWKWTCPKCAMEIVYSLQSMTAVEARKHFRWHEGGR